MYAIKQTIIILKKTEVLLRKDEYFKILYTLKNILI